MRLAAALLVAAAVLACLSCAQALGAPPVTVDLGDNPSVTLKPLPQTPEVQVGVPLPKQVPDLLAPASGRLSPQRTRRPGSPVSSAPTGATAPHEAGSVSAPAGRQAGTPAGLTPSPTSRRLRPIDKTRGRAAPSLSRSSHDDQTQAPASSTTAAPSPKENDAPVLNRIVRKIVGVLPDWVRVVLAALGGLALVLGSIWLAMHRRTRRLRSEGRELSLDAGLLKRTLEPKTPGRLGSLAFSVATEPADTPLGGRGFHDVFPLGANRAGIVIGQVAPQGEAPIALAALIRHRLRAHLELGLPPRSALRRTGELRGEDGAGGVASATVTVYDGARGTLTYACAGHATPLTFGSAADVLTPIPHFSPPLGAGSECGQRQTVISLPPASGACIYSDGVRWLPGNAGRVDLNALRGMEDEVDAASLLARISAPGEERPDDLIVCVLRAALAGFAPPTHIEELVIAPDDEHASQAFLLACGLAPQAAAEVSAGAVDRARTTGRSILRVSWGSDGPGHEVLPYRSDSEWPVRTSIATAAGF